MIVLDVETSGTEPEKHSLLSIGAIYFNHPEKQFYTECRLWEGAHVMDEALAVNGYSPAEIADKTKKSEGEAVKEFLDWLEQSEDTTIAGQNPFFDVGFVRAGAMRNHLDIKMAHRIVDLHSITYFHMLRSGITPPLKNKRTDLNSDSIMSYVGIPAEPKPHIALNGAKWEAEAFSRLIYDKSLFPEFTKYPVPWVKKK